MSTLMKKVEVYCSPSEAGGVREYLSRVVTYFESIVKTRNGEEACRIEFYAPAPSLNSILEDLRGLLDLRRRDNMITVIDVETGAGFPYRYGKRRLLGGGGILSRPLDILLEEAEDKARLNLTYIALASIAGVVALIGLVESNPYIVIGAMLVSPIIAPIYSAALGLATAKPRLVLESVYSLALLLAFAFTSALIAAAGLRLGHYDVSLAPPRLDYSTIIVPSLLGIAVILSEASNTLEALSGVAIAAALIPPLALAAMGVFEEGILLYRGLIIALVNVALLVAFASATARIILRLRRKKGRGVG